MYALESAVLAAWYCSRPEVRRLRALKEEEGFRVLLELEPAQDIAEKNPAWSANLREWTEELNWHVGSLVRLEPLGRFSADSEEVVVADLAWRVPPGAAKSDSNIPWARPVGEPTDDI